MEYKTFNHDNIKIKESYLLWTRTETNRKNVNGLSLLAAGGIPMRELVGTIFLEVDAAGGTILMVTPVLWLKLLEGQYFSHRKADEGVLGFKLSKELDTTPILRLRQDIGFPIFEPIGPGRTTFSVVPPSFLKKKRLIVIV